MLVIARKKNESFFIEGGGVEIEVKVLKVTKGGQLISLGIQAPAHYKVHRGQSTRQQQTHEEKEENNEDEEGDEEGDEAKIENISGTSASIRGRRETSVAVHL